MEEAEQSEEIAEFLEGENYVVLPQGITFADLDKEITMDGGVADTATLTYTYQGTYVGAARVKLSESYRKEQLESSQGEQEEDREELPGKTEEEKKQDGLRSFWTGIV